LCFADSPLIIKLLNQLLARIAQSAIVCFHNSLFIEYLLIEVFLFVCGAGARGAVACGVRYHGWAFSLAATHQCTTPNEKSLIPTPPNIISIITFHFARTRWTRDFSKMKTTKRIQRATSATPSSNHTFVAPQATRINSRK
jgi:hypothetical protein